MDLDRKDHQEALAWNLIRRIKRLRGPYLGDGVNEGIHRNELLAVLETKPLPEAQYAQRAVKYGLTS